ncbi:hypothetical protein RV04_GL001364 [Enterococcus hermanniensis]|uniref:Transposase n=1 Tax=Enterococcus hermanniensis TaxID=249189 RepID=A0A1L8TPU2_9ENTE|nr:hypothetical protein RV04_GL001364 [Enterococcus hermanniensis]
MIAENKTIISKAVNYQVKKIIANCFKTNMEPLLSIVMCMKKV